jgi:hypothetical protein
LELAFFVNIALLAETVAIVEVVEVVEAVELVEVVEVVEVVELVEVVEVVEILELVGALEIVVVAKFGQEFGLSKDLVVLPIALPPCSVSMYLPSRPVFAALVETAWRLRVVELVADARLD